MFSLMNFSGEPLNATRASRLPKLLSLAQLAEYMDLLQPATAKHGRLIGSTKSFSS